MLTCNMYIALTVQLQAHLFTFAHKGQLCHFQIHIYIFVLLVLHVPLLGQFVLRKIQISQQHQSALEVKINQSKDGRGAERWTH